MDGVVMDLSVSFHCFSAQVTCTSGMFVAKVYKIKGGRGGYTMLESKENFNSV